MNPNLKEPNAWLQINFSSLLSKSQSFDEVSHRKAKRMRMIYEQKSPYEALKEQQPPVNVHPEAVNDFYNNPVGYYLNQVNPSTGAELEYQEICTNPSGYQLDLVNHYTPATPQNLIDPQGIAMQHDGYANFEYPVITSSAVALQDIPQTSTSSAETTALASHEIPTGFDCGSELKRIFYSKTYTGFTEFFTSLKKIYPFIERINTKSQLQNWFAYYRYQKASVDVDDCVEIPSVPEGFDYSEELEALFATGKYETAAPFADAVIRKFPFLLKIKTRKQILNTFAWQKRKPLSKVSSASNAAIKPAKQRVTKGFDHVNDTSLSVATIFSAPVAKISSSREELKSTNQRVPIGFDYAKEFAAEFDLNKYPTAAPFITSIMRKFPFIEKLKTKKQIRSWFTGRKQKSQKQIIDPHSSIASSVVDEFDSHSDAEAGSDAISIGSGWDRYSPGIKKESIKQDSPKPDYSPICFSESPDIAAAPTNSVSPQSAAPVGILDKVVLIESIEAAQDQNQYLGAELESQNLPPMHLYQPYQQDYNGISASGNYSTEQAFQESRKLPPIDLYQNAVSFRGNYSAQPAFQESQNLPPVHLYQPHYTSDRDNYLAHHAFQPFSAENYSLVHDSNYCHRLSNPSTFSNYSGHLPALDQALIHGLGNYYSQDNTPIIKPNENFHAENLAAMVFNHPNEFVPNEFFQEKPHVSDPALTAQATFTNPPAQEESSNTISLVTTEQKLHQDESLDSPVPEQSVAAQPLSPEQKVPSTDFDLANNSESMKFLDDFFEEILFG
jgi:hypothetical protein